MNRPLLIRRSCLAVPGSDPHMLAKATSLPADEVLIDLEDSVAPDAKTDATRQGVIEALRDPSWLAPTRAVRVNDVSTQWCFRDVIAIVTGAREAVHAIVIPKVTGPDQVAFVHHLLEGLEADLGLSTRIGLEVQIENGMGAERLPAIADASDRIEALIFGPGDYAASLGIPALSVGAIDPDYPGDQWHYVLSRLVVTASARGLQAIDGPYGAIRDLDGYRETARRSRALGCDGKWALHPDQIPVANEVYSPTQAQFERASAILAAYRQATDVDRRGAIFWDGEMIDEASRKLAENVVSRGTAAGLSLGGPSGHAAAEGPSR
jgi:citrate lyase subunit beta/citryl-CoA lyase